MSRPLLLAFLLAAGCGGARGSAPPSPWAVAGGGPADQVFAQLVDDYFAAGNRFAPTVAVVNGFHEHDGEIEDRSATRIEARVAELHAFLDRLAAIDRARLSFDDAIDAQAIESDARAQLLTYETLRLWETNPMGYASLPGAALDALMKRDFAPKKERLRSLIARLRGVPDLLAAGEANVKRPARELTDVAIGMAKGTVGFLESSVPAWATDAAGGDAQLLAELWEANRAALEAARGYVAYLENDLRPRSTGSFALGEAHFLEKLRLEEMIDVPLADLLARGEAQLEKDHAAFVATARKIDPRQTPAEVFARLAAEHPTAADLVPSVARSVDAARRYVVDHELVTVPSDVRPKIAPTPAYDRGTGFASMDTPGAYETRATEAFYYVEPVEPEWDAKHVEEHLAEYNAPMMALINVHEAYPGHYVQFLYSPRFPTKTRKLVAANTNVEGWAHYTEEMMVDAGFGDGDPKIRLAQLEEALLRDCRYVVGIKLHTAGMTVDDGAKVFVDRCFQQPAVAYVEARRGAFDPTYLYYTLGKLEIQKLRDDYRKQKGGGLKEFHDAFLAQGTLPIPLVRRILLRAPN